MRGDSNRERLTTGIAVMCLGLGVAACGGDDAETIVEEAAEQDEPEIVVGEHFEGTASVDEVVGAHALWLLDTLVISQEPIEVVEGDRALVAGTVREWDPAVIEAETGLDLEESVEELDAELVVVADRVEQERRPQFN